MSQIDQDKRVDYVEFGVTDLTAAKKFYGGAFGWQFKDFGTEYASFRDGRLNGGFRLDAEVAPGGPLVVIYAMDLEAMKKSILDLGGRIVVETFEFPGGRRFHFADPSGNVLAVWSDPLS